MQTDPAERAYVCKLCLATVTGKTSLVEHLRNEHEILEVVSYAAATMIQEEERDRVASEFHRRFEDIRKELTGT